MTTKKWELDNVVQHQSREVPSELKKRLENVVSRVPLMMGVSMRLFRFHGIRRASLPFCHLPVSVEDNSLQTWTNMYKIVVQWCLK